MRFREGQILRIPCSVFPGPFPDEWLVTIRIGNEEVSGFIKKDFVHVEETHDSGWVPGKVLRVHGKAIVVQVPGSLFTGASGQAQIPLDWADSNLELAAPA